MAVREEAERAREEVERAKEEAERTREEAERQYQVSLQGACPFNLVTPGHASDFTTSGLPN